MTMRLSDLNRTKLLDCLVGATATCRKLAKDMSISADSLHFRADRLEECARILKSKPRKTNGNGGRRRIASR